MKRPFAVTLLAVVAVIAGLVAILDTLSYLGFRPIASLGPVNFYGSNFFGAFLAAVVAVIWFSVARQLWSLDPRGWLFVVVIAILYLVLGFVGLLAGNAFQSVSLSLSISAIALLLAMLPGSRAAFGQP